MRRGPTLAGLILRCLFDLTHHHHFTGPIGSGVGRRGVGEGAPVITQNEPRLIRSSDCADALFSRQRIPRFHENNSGEADARSCNPICKDSAGTDRSRQGSRRVFRARQRGGRVVEQAVHRLEHGVQGLVVFFDRPDRSRLWTTRSIASRRLKSSNRRRRYGSTCSGEPSSHRRLSRNAPIETRSAATGHQIRERRGLVSWDPLEADGSGVTLHRGSCFEPDIERPARSV